ncbi:MAG: energy transducer TonB [Bacteroidota bacterium]
MKKRPYIALLFLSLLISQISFGQENTTESNEKKQLKENTSKNLNSDNAFISIREEMPRFPGCEEKELSKKDLEKCAKGKMLDFIYSNLEYPENATNGMVVIQFNIDKKGAMKDLTIARNKLSKECGKAALKVIQKMQQEVTWIPGIQHGKTVQVQYTLPIKFEVDQNK